MDTNFKLSTNTKNLQEYLQAHKQLNNAEIIEKIESAGDGNMNLTLRVYSNQRTFIAKQSFPFVYKYPQVEAPIKRIAMEYAFYQQTADVSVIANASPNAFYLDRNNNLMLMEDLGIASDFTNLYKRGENLNKKDIEALVEYLVTLHKNATLKSETKRIENIEMRTLNHHHIFEFPFDENSDFNLDDVQNGLQSIASKYKKDKALKSEIKIVGDKYLNDDGNVLLHGDYYPGSWMHTKKGLKVIDSEFCFHGFAEFDLGVMLAHLHLAEQSADTIDKVFKMYKESIKIDVELCTKIMGIEIIRRVIGLAQLPLKQSLTEKSQLLEKARKMILN